eukprot:10458703-Ditylum_brightwellii.AAC.1
MRQKTQPLKLYQVHHNRCYGPAFGQSNAMDICLRKMSNASPSGTTFVGNAYECPVGENGDAFLTGKPHFQVSQLE